MKAIEAAISAGVENPIGVMILLSSLKSAPSGSSKVADQRGVDPARRHHVDPHPAGQVLGGQGLREHEEPGLGGAVGGGVGLAHQRGVGGHIDDGPTVLEQVRAAWPGTPGTDRSG